MKAVNVRRLVKLLGITVADSFLKLIRGLAPNDIDGTATTIVSSSVLLTS